MTPTKVSNFRFPPEEVARWRALAVAQRVSLTAWLRNAARNQATFEEEESWRVSDWQLNNPSTRQEEK